MSVIGWIGAILLSLCGLPQALKSRVDGHSRGVSWLFLYMWLIGEVCTLVYVFPMAKWPLIVNYFLNLMFISVILYYKVKPRDTLNLRG